MKIVNTKIDLIWTDLVQHCNKPSCLSLALAWSKLQRCKGLNGHRWLTHAKNPRLINTAVEWKAVDIFFCIPCPVETNHHVQNCKCIKSLCIRNAGAGSHSQPLRRPYNQKHSGNGLRTVKDSRLLRWCKQQNYRFLSEWCKWCGILL